MHVSSSTIGSWGGVYFNSSVGTTSGGSTTTISIYATYGIVSAQYMAVTSDQRIKTDIDYSFSLFDKLVQLKPCIFSYINKYEKGNLSKYGFIAQDVENVFPSCVEKITEHIPDIFTMASVRDISEDGYVVCIPKIGLELKEKDSLELVIDQKNQKIIVDIINIKELQESTEVLINSKEEIRDKVFVIGKRVNDLRVLNYEQITAIAVKSIQELDLKYSKQIEDLTKNINLLIERIKLLEKSHSS